MSRAGILVTKAAWTKMEQICLNLPYPLGFLFKATSGGCNGFNFDLNLLDQQSFVNITPKKPMVLQNNSMGVKLYIDPMSEMFLLGTTIDHVTEDYSNGQFESKFLFRVNPTLASSCGCGISFSPKDP